MINFAPFLALALFALLLSALVHVVCKLCNFSAGATVSQYEMGSRTPLLGQGKNRASSGLKSKPWWRILGERKSLVDEEQGPKPTTRAHHRSDSLADAFADFDETHAAVFDAVFQSDEYAKAENDLLDSLPTLIRWDSGALPSMPQSFAKQYELKRSFPSISCAPVHFVTNRTTQEALVIKQLKCRQANGEFRQPLEAEIVSQHLRPHANIMGVKAVHIAEDGVHFSYANVVMEHCQAGDLFDFIHTFKERGTQVPASFILHFVSSMIDALTFLHHGHSAYDPASERPIIANPNQPAILHRDIKPDNIFLQWRETSKYSMPDIVLADFGHAALESNNLGIRGTVEYYAPEVLQADLLARHSSENEYLSERRKVCSKASDMYSFALTLFDLMTLRHYRPGDDIKKAFDESTVADHVEILIILDSCLVEDPESRRTADAFHFISHAFKQELQDWEDKGERVPEYVWPASFLSRGRIAPASSVYSIRSDGSGSAVAGASFSSTSSEDIWTSDIAAAELEQTLASMQCDLRTMAVSPLRSSFSWSS